jgi:hypothetical protein
MPFEKLLIDDLDSLVTPTGDRLVPLRRLLDALQVDSAYRDGLLSFSSTTAAGPLDVVVDTAGGLIRLNGQSQNIVVVAGVSDITKNDEVYVGAETVALSLNVQLEWDEQKFGFTGKTEQAFALWKHFHESLLAVETAEVPLTLPELLPPAGPRRLSLDFIEFELRPYVMSTGSESTVPAILAIDSPKETFWGSAFGGRYRLQIGQPNLAGSRSGAHGGSMPQVSLDRLEWTYTLPGAQVVVGDSSYGVSDLIFPVMRTTGVHFGGIAGFTAAARGGRAPGAGTSFSRAHVFEGEAPNGSRVELILNGRPIQVQTIISGSYRFEEVRLAPGTLNSVRISITEPSGVTRVIERSVFGRSIQLPRHGFAHLGGIGTNRDFRHWTAWGITGAERILYGVTDSLTVGTTWAAQRGAGPPVTNRLTDGERTHPESSIHRGGQVSWVLAERLQFIGDIAFSHANREHVSEAGHAYRVTTDLFPRRDMRFSSQWFGYSAGFFNGDNLLLSDRAGYTFDFSWNIHRRLRANSSGGSIRNNLDGRALDPFRLDFQKLELNARISPRLAAVIGVHRVVDSHGAGAAVLYTSRLQSNPYKSVSIDASFSTRASLSPSIDIELSNGLTIPGFSAYQLQVTSAVARVPLNTANALGVSYFRGPAGHRISIIESFLGRTKPLRLSTEVGYDRKNRRPFFGERFEYRFDRAGRKAGGVDVRYELGQWTSSVNLTYGELFRNDGGIPRPVADPDFTVENGAIHGKVFVDANADGKRDPEEPGVEGVQVITDNGTKIVTDKNGSFVIPGSGQAARYRVFLDIDSIPAIYSPTHGIQSANVRSWNLTEINLGVSPLNSISGSVHIRRTEEGGVPITGARVVLRRASDDTEAYDSVTGNDGAYYLSDIRPGLYSVHVDPQTLPAGAAVIEQQMVEVRPATEPQDLKLPIIHVQHDR